MERYYQNLMYSVQCMNFPNCIPEDISTWGHLDFPSAECTLKFYRNYAKVICFIVRTQKRMKVNSAGQKTDTIQYAHYVCNNEGYKKGSVLDPKNKLNVDSIQVAEMAKERTKLEFRCGCNAEIRFKFFEDINCFKITSWFSEHNHVLHPPEHSQFLNHEIEPVHAALAQINAKVEIPVRSSFELIGRCAGGSENISFLAIDLKNMLATKRQVELERGEGTCLLEYFREQSLKKPNYFYSVQVDTDEQITSIFWSDGLMRADYEAFGDVIIFDTTFSTNRLYRPLAAFIGFNQHREMCIFGMALLFNETGETFECLFNTFFECMNSKLPKSFLTDQCAAIQSVVKKVMPLVFHGLCSWHIGENAKKNLVRYYDTKFGDELHFLINKVDSPEEFDFNWNIMVEECFVGKDEDHISWLGFLRSYKEKWSSAWLKNHFTAGLKSTQMSESFNSVVKRYVKPSCSLSKFFERFNTMVTRLRARELTSNFSGIQYFPKNNFPHSVLMKNAAQIYTASIFTRVHTEFEQIHAYYFEEDISRTEVHLKRFHVFQLGDVSNLNSSIDERVVDVDLERITISCTCRMFINWGFVCRHMFKIVEIVASSGMNPKFRTIPDHYILKRWSKDAKGGVELYDKEPVDKLDYHGATYEQRYQQICLYFNVVATCVSMFDETYEFFLKDLIEDGKRAEYTIQSMHPVSKSDASKSKAPLDSLARGINPASNRKNSRKRMKSFVESNRWKKRASRKKLMEKAILNKELTVDSGHLSASYFN